MNTLYNSAFKINQNFNFVSDQHSEHAPVRKLDREGDEETGLEVDVWNYSGKIIYSYHLFPGLVWYLNG